MHAKIGDFTGYFLLLHGFLEFFANLRKNVYGWRSIERANKDKFKDLIKEDEVNGKTKSGLQCGGTYGTNG